MTNRALCGLLLLAGAGVANAQLHGPETPCNTGICAIVVTAATDSDGTCSLSIDKPVLSTNNSVVLVWFLTPDNYAFASNGIDFDNPPNPAEFSKISQQDREIKYRDTHPQDQYGYFHYTVNVKGCPPLDPYIHNN